MASERVLRRKRLVGKYIQGGGGYLAGVQRRQQVGLDRNFAAGAVHQANLRFHFGERGRVQQSTRLVGNGKVNGDEIGIPIDVVQVGGQLNSQRSGPGFREKWVVAHHAHAERQGPPRHFTSN